MYFISKIHTAGQRDRGTGAIHCVCRVGCIVYSAQLEKIMERMRRMEVYGQIMEKAIELNEQPGIDVYICVNGETQVMSLTVMQNKSVVYQNRLFFQNRKKHLKQMEEHLDKMLEVAQCREIITRMG